MNQREQDIYYMRMALAEAEKGRGFTNPNPMVGAVIVKDGQVIAKGYHHRCGEGHAEVEAFRAAGDADVTGATIYVTLEPCSHYGKTPPCADLIIRKQVGRVVIAAMDPNPLVAGRGAAKIREAGIEVVSGLLAEESIRLNEIFMKYIVGKEPFVLYKSAMSLDGKMATPAGESQWISCEESRRRVHELRGQYMAIMVGSETVLLDDPMLNCRIPGGRNPVRVVCDTRLRIPLESKLVQTAGEIPTIVACSSGASLKKMSQLQAAGVQLLPMEVEGDHINLRELTLQLGSMGIDSILLEGGPTLAYAAFESGIVDKVQFYLAPILIGGAASRTGLEGSGIRQLADAFALHDLQVTSSGTDLCVTAYTRKEA